MVMNFFEHQDKARRNTTKLVAIYFMAVVGLILIVWLPVTFLMRSQGGSGISSADHFYALFMVVAGVCSVIGIGSLFKTLALRAGGPAIAESLGGRELRSGASDPLERRIVNVVEEMAIAAGCPVPAIYLLDEEQGINAFAAGFSLDDAAIGITRGCAEQLTRDQLQGVVAHEFSHIFNGDMKLNLRLIGILAGICLLSTIGYILFRVGLHTSRGNKKEGAGAGAAILAAGGLLYLAGSLGGLAAALIQAAISRQREFLADSSAVQFTRNPDGIAGALKKIGGFPTGSKIKNPHVTETRHMFFSLAMKTAFSTHPPLDERISRIDASWEYEKKMDSAMAADASPTPGASGFAGASVAPLAEAVPAGDASSIVNQVGAPTPAHVAYAQGLKEQIPEGILDRAHEAYSARAVVYAMLLDKRDADNRSAQLAILQDQSNEDVLRLTRECLADIKGLSRPLYLPLLEICKASLRGLPGEYFQRFKTNIQALVAADKKITLFEWSLQRSLVHHLEAHQRRRFGKAKNSKKLSQLAGPARLLLSTLCYAGHSDQESSSKAFAAAGAELEVPWDILPASDCSLTLLDGAVASLARLRPKHKEVLIAACVAAVTADERISVKEAELLRAVTELLECPLPPLLPASL